MPVGTTIPISANKTTRSLHHTGVQYKSPIKKMSPRDDYLEEVEEVLVGLQLQPLLLAERLEAAPLLVHHHEVGQLPLVLLAQLLAVRHHLLQRDLVLHQQADLDVHQVEVVLQLLVGADVGHHLLAQPHQVQLLLEVLVAVVQQVDKLPNHSHGRVVCADCAGGRERVRVRSGVRVRAGERKR